MTIQAAVKACLSQGGKFGRPVSWKGTSLAVDLGRRLDKGKTRRIQSLDSPNNLIGSEWDVSPEDFLEDWEIVTAEDLAREACQVGSQIL